MAFFPLRHTIECDLQANEVIRRLEHYTDSRPRKSWAWFADTPCLKLALGARRFLGEVDTVGYSFHLHTNLTSSDRMQTAFTGNVEASGTGSLIRLWISPTKVGMVGISLFIAAMLFGIVFRMRPDDQIKGAGFLCAMLALFFVIDLIVHAYSKRLFLRTITGEEDEITAVKMGRPLATATFKGVKSGTPQSRQLPQSASILDHFRAALDSHLAGLPMPPHAEEASSDKTKFSIVFPPQNDDGYQVKVEIDGENVAVLAGNWIRDEMDVDGLPSDVADMAAGLVRDLLSPACRLREKYVGEELYWAGVDAMSPKGWDETDMSYTARVVASGSEKTELTYINHQLPLRS